MRDEVRKLTCLSCGGQLSINLNQSITQCPYCGNVYLLQDLLDQKPFCPICRKNDRVVQAASIKKDDHKYQSLRFNIKDFYLPEKAPDLDDNTKTIGSLGGCW